MSGHKEKTYSIEFTCSNCFAVFKQDFPYGIDVQKSYHSQGYFIRTPYEYIRCCNCGSFDIGKTGNFVEQKEDEEAGHGQVYSQK